MELFILISLWTLYFLYINVIHLSFQTSKLAPTSKPGTQQRDRSTSSVSVHSLGRPKSSLSTLTDKETPEPALEDISEDPSVLEQEMQYEEQIRLDKYSFNNFFCSEGKGGGVGVYLSENLIDSSTKGTGKCLTK